MKTVAKYNLLKGVSTGLTFGTPIVTLACTGDFFVHRSDTAMSAGAMFVLLICLFFAKDKIVEHFKMPAPAIFCAICLGIIVMIEHIIYPMKIVCIATLITTGIDEISFKRMYKNIENNVVDINKANKHLGFMITTTKKLEGGDNNDK